MWILLDKPEPEGTNLKSFRVKFKLCVDSTSTCTPGLMQQHCSHHSDDYHAVLKSLGVLSARFFSPLWGSVYYDYSVYIYHMNKAWAAQLCIQDQVLLWWWTFKNQRYQQDPSHNASKLATVTMMKMI
jgi:hypothetical protein